MNQAPVVRKVPASPDVLLLQPPNARAGLFSDTGCIACATGVQLVADNFVVSTGGLGVEVTQCSIWGGRYPGDSPWPAGAAFQLFCHQDSWGLPGTVVCSYSDIVPTATQTGVVLFGVNEYFVDFLLQTPCSLADGIYWLQTYTDTSPSPDDFFWELGNLDPVAGIPGCVSAIDVPASSWNFDGFTDLSLRVQGTIVPVELQSLALE